MWKQMNLNPNGQRVGDCVVRALSMALGQTWEKTYIGLCLQGFEDYNLPSANVVWGRYLARRGFKRHTVDDDCTVREFCEEHPKGVYVLGTGSHAVTISDGSYYDFWDSGNEFVLYFYTREEDE